MKINRKQSIQSYKPFNKVSRQNEKPLDKVSIGGNSKDNTFLMADKLRSMKSSRYMSPMESMLEAATCCRRYCSWSTCGRAYCICNYAQ